MTATQAPNEAIWLTPGERSAWLEIAALTMRLQSALDTQLQRDDSLSFFEYMVLAMLSEEPDRSLQMSQLAGETSASLSRLSHTIARLERQGFVRRERLPGPGRRTAAHLTDAGWDKIRAAAPGHVRRVRELVIDAVPAGQLADVGDACRQILERIDAALALPAPTREQQPEMI